MSHIRVFGYQVWVPQPDPRKYTIGAHRQKGVYVGFDSPSIIRYLDPSIGNLYKAKFANYRLIETNFPALSLALHPIPLNFGAPETLTMNPNPPTSLPNTKVIKLLNLRNLAENTPDGFSIQPRIIRNPIPGTCNVLPRKRPNPTPSTSQPPKYPRVHYTTDYFDSIVETNPLCGNTQTPKTLDWRV